MDCPSPRGRIVLRTQHPGDALSWGRFVRGCFVRGRIVRGRIVRVPFVCLEPSYSSLDLCKTDVKNLFFLQQGSRGWSTRDLEMLSVYIEEYIAEKHYSIDPGKGLLLNFACKN
jgi:hypothetical protein